jgi:hypothetical protein
MKDRNKLDRIGLDWIGLDFGSDHRWIYGFVVTADNLRGPR